jgi:hypothetical protein
MAPGPGKRKRTSVAATPTRSTCSICRSRKHADDFPTRLLDGLPSLATCTSCLQNSLPLSQDWREVGLQPPPSPPPSPTPSDASSDSVSDTTPAEVHCRICIESRPITDFPVAYYVLYTGPFASLDQKRKAIEDTGISPLPLNCTGHLALNPSRLEKAVCNFCITLHLKSRMETLGAEHVSCIEPGCKEYWGVAALSYLPNEMHEEYHKQLFDAFWYQVEKWECPSSKCNCPGMFMSPTDTPGFPRVECYGCEQP